MIRGIGKNPFINLDPFLDIEGFKKLHPEICKGFALAREHAKEGTWMKPGFDMRESSYIANWKPIYKAYEEFQALPDDDPIKIEGMKIFPQDMRDYKERNVFVRYLVSAMGAHDPYIYYVLWEEGHNMKDRGEVERKPTPEQEHFPGVVKWVENLKEQNIIEHIGRVIFFVSSSSSQPFEHRDLDPEDPSYTDHNVEFIHIRPCIKRGFYLWDPETKRKHYVNHHACFFNDEDWHGGEHSMEQEYGLRIDCKFTEYFKTLIGISHLRHY
mgnify:CR=1 FL=1